MSEESFWLCACLDEQAEVVQCPDSTLVGACIFCFGEFNAGIHLKEFGIRDSGHRECSGETASIGPAN